MHKRFMAGVIAQLHPLAHPRAREQPGEALSRDRQDLADAGIARIDYAVSR
jgi:hypothetical protein